MKNDLLMINKKISYIAFVLLVISFFLPLGRTEENIITIIPVFSNFFIESIKYEWVTSAVFSVTSIIIAPLLIYFANKGYRTGLNILGGMLVVCTFFLFAALFITFHEAARTGTTGSFSYGFIPLIVSIVLIFVAANK